MIITGTKNEMERYIVPAGTHPAICVGVIDCGTQHWEYMGEDKQGHKVRLQWELPNEETWTGDDGVEHARTISTEYTASLHEKSNLRKALVGWRSRDFTEDELAGFDLTSVLGKPCMLSIIHKTKATGGQYAKVDNVSVLVRGLTLGRSDAVVLGPDEKGNYPSISPKVSYSIEDGNNDVFKTFPEWIQNILIASEEFQNNGAPPSPATKVAAHEAAKKLEGKVVDPTPTADVPF